MAGRTARVTAKTPLMLVGDLPVDQRLAGGLANGPNAPKPALLTTASRWAVGFERLPDRPLDGGRVGHVEGGDADGRMLGQGPASSGLRIVAVTCSRVRQELCGGPAMPVELPVIKWFSALS